MTNRTRDLTRPVEPDLSGYPPALQAQIRQKLAAQDRTQAAVMQAVLPQPTCEHIREATELILTPAPDEKAVRRNAQIEWQEQCTYFAQIDAAAAMGRHGADMIYAVTNSNVAGKVIGGKLVRAGLRKGYPDINIDVPMRNALGEMNHGARIEMKTPQGSPSDVKPHQREWHERLNALGYVTVVCYGWREALAFTRHYLGWDSQIMLTSLLAAAAWVAATIRAANWLIVFLGGC